MTQLLEREAANDTGALEAVNGQLEPKAQMEKFKAYNSGEYIPLIDFARGMRKAVLWALDRKILMAFNGFESHHGEVLQAAIEDAIVSLVKDNALIKHDNREIYINLHASMPVISYGPEVAVQPHTGLFQDHLEMLLSGVVPVAHCELQNEYAPLAQRGDGEKIISNILEKAIRPKILLSDGSELPESKFKIQGLDQGKDPHGLGPGEASNQTSQIRGTWGRRGPIL